MNRQPVRLRTAVNDNCENAVFRTKTQARQLAQIVNNGILADRRNTQIVQAEIKPAMYALRSSDQKMATSDTQNNLSSNERVNECDTRRVTRSSTSSSIKRPSDPLLVDTYAKEIFAYMKYLETKTEIQQNHLSIVNSSITGKMRAILVDWLVQVLERYNLAQETLYLTISLVDRYLQEARVPKEELQLIGVTAMLIAAKYEEIYAPEVNDFAYITAGTYSREQIIEMERKMLFTLQFHVGRPLAINYLRRYSHMSEATAIMHTIGKYTLETCLIDYNLSSVLPSKYAAGAVWLSRRLTQTQPTWSHTLSIEASCDEVNASKIGCAMAKVLHKIHSGRERCKTVQAKYSTIDKGEIAQHELLSVDNLTYIIEEAKRDS